jgi:hypothetical protein
MKLTKTQLKEIIREEIKLLNESNYEYGFDLTGISSKKWKELLKMFSIPTTPKLENKKWIWKSTKHNVVIVTANDPISGKYAAKGTREDEVDYASYIGVEGDKDIVVQIVRFINKNADDIKDQQVGRRFI